MMRVCLSRWCTPQARAGLGKPVPRSHHTNRPAHTDACGRGSCLAGERLPSSVDSTAPRQAPTPYEAVLTSVFSHVRSRATGTEGRNVTLTNALDGAIADPSAEKSTSEKDLVSVRFTQEQANVLRLVLDGASVFIGGKAGTGKSFLLREIAHRLQDGFGLRVAVTASTGVAALNIDGNTFHSAFGVPVVADDPSDGKRISRFRGAAPVTSMGDGTGEASGRRHPRLHTTRITFDVDALARTDVVIVDEVSLLHAGYLEALERAARRAVGKSSHKPFGGIQVILSGDFMQLTPFRGHARSGGVSTTTDRIVCRGVCSPSGEASSRKTTRRTTVRGLHRRHAVAHYTECPMYESYVFHHCFLHLQLTQPVRQRDDAMFTEELNQLRQGELPYRLSRCAFLNPPDPNAIRLFAVKSAVKTFNETSMLKLPGEARTFRSHIELRPTTGAPSADSRTSMRCTQSVNGGVVTASRTTAGARRYCSHTALLHLHQVRRSHRSLRSRTRGITQSEANRILWELCEAAHVSTNDLRSLRLPLRLSPYSSGGVSTVAVRCAGSSKRNAVDALERLLTAAAKSMRVVVSQAGERVKETSYRYETKPTTCAPGFAETRPPPPLSPPWQLLRWDAYSADKLTSLLQPHLQQRFLNSVRTDFALQSKTLKVGCRVMLLRNLNTSYVNGSLGTIVAFASLSSCAALLPEDLKVSLPWSHRVVQRSVPRFGDTRSMLSSPETAKEEEEVEDGGWGNGCGGGAIDGVDVKLPLVRMDVDNCIVAIPWVTLPLPPALQDEFFTGKVVCMPLAPAYAFTVHKIQGVTLDHPILFDGNGMFPCDHLLYVAASRVKRFSQVRWVNVSPRMITVHRLSLRFSDSLPSVEEAVAAWKAWKASSRRDGSSKPTDTCPLSQTHTKTRLYFPTWRSEK